MKVDKTYILFLKGSQEAVMTPDAPIIAQLLKYSKHTVRDWFRNGVSCVDRYDKEGFILIKGAEYIKSPRGANNFKKKKYNW